MELTRRELSEIHDDKDYILKKDNGFQTNYIHLKYKQDKLQDIDLEDADFKSVGCCSSTKYLESNAINNKQWLVLKIKYDEIPSKFDYEFITNYVNLLNKVANWIDIKILKFRDDITVDQTFWQKHNINNFIMSSGYHYFIIKQSNDEVKNLATLQLFRYIKESEYYFMAWDAVKIRKDKTLKKLNNWDILTLSVFGVQYTKINASEKMFAYYYRSPFCIQNRILYKFNKHLDIKLYKNRFETTNYIANDYKYYIDIDVIYLMGLYAQGEYMKIINLINNKKYHIHTSKKTKNITTINFYGSNDYIKTINEYIKTKNFEIYE